MAHDKPQTWVLTLDGARARIYTTVLPQGQLTLLPDGSLEGTRATSREINSDRPGRAQESVGGIRHAVEPRTDAHRHAEEEFARHVANKLKHDAESGRFDHLIVVAAPKTLGDLRTFWDSHFRERFVKLEIDGDWTKLSATQVADHLRPHLSAA